VRYLPPIARDNIPERLLVGTGYAWAALMFALGALNIVIAVTLPFRVGAWFVSIGAIGAKIVAFLVQYVIFRASEAARGRRRRPPRSRRGRVGDTGVMRADRFESTQTGSTPNILK